MADQEQLQLVVTFVDQASAGLRALRNELQQTSTTGGDKLKRDAEEIEKRANGLGEHTRKLREGISEGGAGRV
jgi:hypothetical protein